MRMPRVAIFTDSYHEANAVACTSKALEACAKRRGMSLLLVHAGPETRLVHDGSITRLDLKRWRPTSFRLEHEQQFDLALWRYVARLTAILRWFAPEVLHFTGPGDVGQLGAYLGHRLGIPMVASWHTNLQHHASRRVGLKSVEQPVLRALMQFYKIPRVILAPSDEQRALLHRETGKPTVLMPRGVDTRRFTPARRRHPNWIVNVGYVGPLLAEANVRLLQVIEETLDAEGLDVRFTVVGDGSERAWLERHMQRAEFTGVLHGGELATAYAEMDILACPTEIDPAGNVVLEAMASGVPVVAMDGRGPTLLPEHGRTGLIARDPRGFVDAVRGLVRSRTTRETLGAAARARALEHSSWDRMFDNTCDAYELARSLASQAGPASGAPPSVVAGQRRRRSA